MLPLPMNEYVQENLNAVGFDTQFEVMEWNALVTFGFQPVTGDASTKAGTNGINISRATVDPYSAFMRLYHSDYVPPKGANWGILKDPKLDELINKAHTSFDRAAQTKALADVHTYIVDQAYWVYIAHDLNPRAMSPKVTGFVQAQSWFQDLTPIVDEVAAKGGSHAALCPAATDLPGAGRLRRVAARLRAGAPGAGRSDLGHRAAGCAQGSVDKLKEYYGFDKPLPVQYLRWLR